MAGKSQLELLVQYQDLVLMLQELRDEAVRGIGFQVENLSRLEEAIQELERALHPRYLRTFQRIAARQHRPIAPVSRDVCLGCFARQPTSYKARAWDDSELITCEQCGRILYWID
ncbi:hypothetical protein JXO52_16995 [bacterium]|nr:hypothetical protein [bacterium]